MRRIIVKETGETVEALLDTNLDNAIYLNKETDDFDTLSRDKFEILEDEDIELKDTGEEDYQENAEDEDSENYSSEDSNYQDNSSAPFNLTTALVDAVAGKLKTITLEFK